MECKCDMRTKLVGDGCEACNPNLALELTRAELDDFVAELHQRAMLVCDDDYENEPLPALDLLRAVLDERDRLRTNTQSLAMMLRKCAHRLKCNGHEDLSADVVGLLRRYGLLGSPLRGTETEHG